MAGKAVILMPETMQTLEKMGIRIKKARLRRNIRAEQLAERAGISKGTLSAIEKGVPTVSIGAYTAVLCALDMESDLDRIALDEKGKRQYRDLNLPNRIRAKGR